MAMSLLYKTKRPFNLSQISQVPQQPGVYWLYVGLETIYIGKSSNDIRGRLQSHYSGNEGRCTQSALEFAYEACTNPVQREKELLEEYRRTYGKLPRCNEVLPR